MHNILLSQTDHVNQVSSSIVADLEHERTAKLDGQLQLLEEVWASEGGDAEVVPLLFLAYPVEGVLLRVNAERVSRGLEGRKRRGGEGGEVHSCHKSCILIGQL